MKNQKSKAKRKKELGNKYSIKDVELFYFYLKNSILDAKLIDAKKYLGLLKDINKKHPNYIKNGLNSIQKQDLSLLEKQVLNKGLLNKVEPVDDYSAIKSESDPIPEKEIVDYLIRDENYKILGKTLKMKNPKWGGAEIPIDTGRLDLILDDKTELYSTRYIIELKTNIADHKVIGQIRKYEIYYLKRLMYKLWDKVQTVVIAHGFHGYVISELKKANVIPILYENSGNSISFYAL